jgi:hypothetical protein
MVKKQKRKKHKQSLHFDSSSEDGDINEKELCNNDELGNVGSLGCTKNDLCSVCGVFEHNEALCFHCVMCSNWIHAECSGWETAHNYICDSA